MSILPDNWLRSHKDEIFLDNCFNETTREVLTGETRMNSHLQKITPHKKVISYGVSSYGYDMRIGKDFKVFKSTHCGVIDPKNMSEECFDDIKATGGDYILIPPNSFALGHSVERLRIPDGVMCICLGKSTYARCGIIVNVTPLEPGWEGHVTIEISNTAPLPAKIYVNEGICQVLFLQGAALPDHTYTTKEGGSKYQNQGAEVTLPKV